MAKYTSKGNVEIEAYVVTPTEGKLSVQLDGGGMEQLLAGDALINAPDGSATFVLRARLFAALFEEQPPQSGEDDPPEDDPSFHGGGT